MTTTTNKSLIRLLTAIGRSADAKAVSHDIIFLAAAQRIREMEDAIAEIWHGFQVVSSNGGTGWSRHVERPIFDATKLIDPEKRRR